jgi:hypothetical protein
MNSLKNIKVEMCFTVSNSYRCARVYVCVVVEGKTENDLSASRSTRARKLLSFSLALFECRMNFFFFRSRESLHDSSLGFCLLIDA